MRTEGQRAYELAVMVVELVTRSHDDEADKSGTPSLHDRAESLVPGGSLQLLHHHDEAQLFLFAGLERYTGDFIWHVRVMNSLGVNVLNVVYSTAPSASECEVLRFYPGSWESRLCG